MIELVSESDDPIDQVHNAILDIITPLESQGVLSITFQQITDQLRRNPLFRGLQITDAFISQGIEDIDGINAEPDAANNNEMTITFDDNTKAPEAKVQSDKGANNIDKAATRQATKDLG